MLEAKKRYVYNHGPALLALFEQAFVNEWSSEFDIVIDALDYLTGFYTATRCPKFVGDKVLAPWDIINKNIAEKALKYAKEVVSIAGKYLEEKIFSLVKTMRSDITAIILFGSTVYMGRGRDLDIIVVVENYLKDPINDSIDLRTKLNKILKYNPIVDVHVFTIEDFKSNLISGSFLSGLALGYEVIYDRSQGRIHELIMKMLEELSKSEHILVNRYGEWSL